MRFVTILIGLGLLAFLSGCGSAPPKATMDAEDQFLLAKERYDHGKHLDAQIEFQKLIWNFPGSDYVDDAHYYLAECFFCQEDYLAATHEYQRLTSSFSQSPFAGPAQYKIGLCYYEQSLPVYLDQDFTDKTIRELRIFLEDYPNSDYVPEAQKLLLASRTKLAHKDLLNGKLYYKMKEYVSAIIYLEELLENYHDTKWAADAQYVIGECYRNQQKWGPALSAFQNVLQMDASQKLARRAQKRIDQVEKNLKTASE